MPLGPRPMVHTGRHISLLYLQIKFSGGTGPGMWTFWWMPAAGSNGSKPNGSICLAGGIPSTLLSSGRPLKGPVGFKAIPVLPLSACGLGMVVRHETNY
jgi:hypothetical protein